MTRGQRAIHQRVWWVLGPLLLVAVGYALLRRAEVPAQEPPAVVQELQ